VVITADAARRRFIAGLLLLRSNAKATPTNISTSTMVSLPMAPIPRVYKLAAKKSMRKIHLNF
jgi:hypothetical protein